MSDAVMVPREPTEAMVMAARGLIMARDLQAPNASTTLGDVARSGFYGEHWRDILTDEEKAIAAPLTKGHLAQLIYRAMLAASTPVGGWEDISTAPKDGTWVLVWRGFCSVDAYKGDWCGEKNPTHWMPLPPPPSVSIDNGSRPQEAVPTEQAELAVVEPTEAMRDGQSAAFYRVKAAIERAMQDERDGKPCGCIIEAGCEARSYGDPEYAASGFIWDAAQAALIAATPQPAHGCSSNEGAGHG